MTWDQEIMEAEDYGAKKERVIWEKKLTDKDAEIAALKAKLKALENK